MGDTSLDYINDPFATPNSAANEVVQQINKKGGIGGGGGSSGPILSTTVSLSASQINHLFSAPATLVDAPGVGKAIIPLQVIVDFQPVAVAYDSDTGDIWANYAGQGTLNIVANLHTSLAGFASGSGGGGNPGDAAFATVSPRMCFRTTDLQLRRTVVENEALVIFTPTDLIGFGGINANSLSAGGLNYAPNDTGSISGNNGNGTYKILTVGAGGAVLTYQITFPGIGYATGVASTQVITGSGDGNFAIDVTSITPGDGTAQVTAIYQVLTLP